MKLGIKFVNIPTPILYAGENATLEASKILFEKNIKRVFIVTGKHIYASGLLNNLLDEIRKNNIDFYIFTDLSSNPSIDDVEKGVIKYKEFNAEAILAFGGGSPMDCAKVIGARIVRPSLSVSKMKGLLKIRKKLPFFIAIPTTAGTGSEATIAAVISNHDTLEKYAISDPHFVPNVAILDPNLIVELPNKITSTTGMDALTHAVESFIGNSNTKQTKIWAIAAIKLIFENLEESYNNPSSIRARENMLLASCYAGLAFTRAYVGYVHAIAHALGGYYNIPHGLANAIILPEVLEYYGSSIYKKISCLYDQLKLGPNDYTEKEKCKVFIEKIKTMNKNMGIPNSIDEIKEQDIKILAQRAEKEANPLYPVPRLFSLCDFEKIIIKIKGE
ncbi:MAG: iron-containing alcohol dehydrogenase [Bacillales bacterium]|nr:iron-containing alcohol dehydrogenase [Bacillales bacterium]